MSFHFRFFFLTVNEKLREKLFHCEMKENFYFIFPTFVIFYWDTRKIFFLEKFFFAFKVKEF